MKTFPISLDISANRQYISLMTTNDYRDCRDCGDSFKKSPADTTVRCPECRAGRKARPINRARQDASATVCCPCGKTVYSYAGRQVSASCPNCG